MNELRRLYQATLNSLAGLAITWRDEQAFRSQCLFYLVLVPVAWIMASSALELLALLGVLVLILIVELINTAIEATVDRIGPEIHPQAKKAKDCGSAAVFVSMLLAAAVWLVILLN